MTQVLLLDIDLEGSVVSRKEDINTRQDDEIRAEPENSVTDGAGGAGVRRKEKKKKLAKTETVGLSEESTRSKPRKTSAMSRQSQP